MSQATDQPASAPVALPVWHTRSAEAKREPGWRTSVRQHKDPMRIVLPAAA